MLNQQKGWLTVLGEQELEVIRGMAETTQHTKQLARLGRRPTRSSSTSSQNYYLPSYDRTSPAVKDRYYATMIPHSKEL